jgi:hypothetical protein
MLASQAEIKVTFENLVKEIGLLQTREIISSWYGTKVARIGIHPKLVNTITEALSRLNLHFFINSELVFLKRDIGKGGWSNKYDERDDNIKKTGDLILYVSNDIRKLRTAVNSDVHGNDGEFGLKLGIPECCINFYLENRERAYSKQNDFVPLVYINSNELHSFNFWNNYVAQYFGYSFLSHFPCSFNCDQSATLAKHVYEQLKTFLPVHAEKIVHFQKQPILYTEYRGIYMFENAQTTGKITKVEDCIIHSTLSKNAKTVKSISQLKKIEILSKNKICFYNKFNESKIISNSNYVMCTFSDNE